MYLGSMYSGGKGASQNYNEAFNWYMKAAELGNSCAQVCLGMMYAEGEGVQQDYKEAFKWFIEAAQKDDSDAQGNLGYL